MVTNANKSAAQDDGSLDNSWVMAVMGKANGMLSSVLGDAFHVAGLRINMVLADAIYCGGFRLKNYQVDYFLIDFFTHLSTLV